MPRHQSNQLSTRRDATRREGRETTATRTTMSEDAKTATAYGAIARDVDVEATPLEGERSQHETLAAQRARTKNARAGRGGAARASARWRGRARRRCSPRRSVARRSRRRSGWRTGRITRGAGSTDFETRGSAARRWSAMTDAQKSANVVNWCRFHNNAANGNFRCAVNCRQSGENGNEAPEVFYIGSTPADDDGNVYRTISRKGADGNMYVCYSDWSHNNGWQRKVMKCPTSGFRAVLTNSASLPEGAKLTISEVPAAKIHTQNVEYLSNMGTAYTFVNKELAAKDGSAGDKGLCRDFGSEVACSEKVKDSNIRNVNNQFELIPVVPDGSGDVSACPA